MFSISFNQYDVQIIVYCWQQVSKIGLLQPDIVMDHILHFTRYVFVYTLLQICINILPVSTFLRISAISPVNPVKIGGILSIRCQVWDLDIGHEITLSRKCAHGPTERLSWNEDVLPAIEDRVFLASRKLADGSTIFFLSVIDIDKPDECDYSCKVLNSDTLLAIASDEVKIDVMYFPKETYPMCSSSYVPTSIINHGDIVTLNCSSEIGKPVVGLEWSFAGHTNIVLEDTETHVRHGMVVSQTEVRPSDQDIYICTIKSEEFPEVIRVCHIGPISVQPSTDATDVTVKTNAMVVVDTIPKIGIVVHPTRNNANLTQCPGMCAPIMHNRSYIKLKVTTIIASTIAIVMLLIVITLNIKLRNTDRLVRTFKNAKGHSFTYMPTANSEYEATYRSGYSTHRYQGRTYDIRNEVPEVSMGNTM